MERRFEKTRSWKRCSAGSSNSNARTMSLESGTTLFRLNQELLPDPGSPIARTTTPFGGRDATTGGTAGGPVGAADSATGGAARPAADGVSSEGASPIALTAAGVKARPTGCRRSRPPRPRPPRRRRPRLRSAGPLREIGSPCAGDGARSPGPVASALALSTSISLFLAASFLGASRFSLTGRSSSGGRCGGISASK